MPCRRGHYLNYEQLKRLVYAVEAQQSAAQRASLDLSRRPSGVQEDPEAGSPLLPGGSEVEGGQEAEAEFVSCAEGELKRVHAFLTAREAGLLGQWEEAALAAHSAEASYVPARTTRGGAFTRSHWWQQPTMQARPPAPTSPKNIHQFILSLSPSSARRPAETRAHSPLTRAMRRVVA